MNVAQIPKRGTKGGAERTQAGDLSVAELERRHREYMDAQPMVARCGEPGCGKWRHEGTVGSCRAAAAAHLEDHHPGLAAERRRERERAERAAKEAAREQEKQARAARQRRPAPAPNLPAATPPRPKPAPKPARGPGRAKVTAEEAVAALKGFAADLGHTPSSSEWNGSGRKPSLPVYYRLFGNWAKACDAAGLEPRQARPQKPGEEAAGAPPPMEQAGAADQPAPLADRAAAVLAAARVDLAGTLPGTDAELGEEIARHRATAVWLRRRAAAHEEAAAGLEDLRDEALAA